MQRIERLGAPKDPQGTMEIRFVNEDGKTEAWWIQMSPEIVHQFRKAVKMAGIDDGVDLRLATQKATIDKLLSHLKHHCPLFGTPPSACDYEESRPSDGATG